VLPMPICSYNRWHHETGSRVQMSLLPRTTLETWLFRLFLKIAMPKDKRQIQSQTLIYSPLNLTAIFRICWHLCNVGYPAHWMSGVLSELLSGKITTAAWPPKSEPLAIPEVKAAMPEVEQTLYPFVAELTTLASMWHPCLPFGTFSPNIPVANKIRKYSISINDVPDYAGNIQNFILVFFDNTLPAAGQYNLRPFVLSDELADRSTKARTLHTKGLHIVSPCTWARSAKVATFWLREDVFEPIVRPATPWLVAIWRMDNWQIYSAPQRLNGDDEDCKT